MKSREYDKRLLLARLLFSQLFLSFRETVYDSLFQISHSLASMADIEKCTEDLTALLEQIKTSEKLSDHERAMIDIDVRSLIFGFLIPLYRYDPKLRIAPGVVQIGWFPELSYPLTLIITVDRYAVQDYVLHAQRSFPEYGIVDAERPLVTEYYFRNFVDLATELKEQLAHLSIVLDAFKRKKSKQKAPS